MRPGTRRNRLGWLLAFMAGASLGAIFLVSKGTGLLMPGPLTSAHGAIEACSTCHTSSGGGKLSWIHGLVAGDPLADSKACLTCHRMPQAAFAAHGASPRALEESTRRLTSRVSGASEPFAARAQGIAFPAAPVLARDLYCATCHQEHRGAGFDLKSLSNEQCRSCHVVRFDSFDGGHPEFDRYPFERRTRIVYDHAGHFDTHYPELAKKEPAKPIPESCSSCHDSRGDRRVMGVKPFEQTCASCHLDQIIGKGRASGPKGVAFLTLPGLDLETLRKRNAPIGEWPEASDATLTPFMKVLLGRDERGRGLLRAVASLDLQNLARASDDQIKAVTDLAWEIKALIHALITGKASDVLGNLEIGGERPGPALVADLTASLPRDVVVGAQQQWLPHLATEMARGGGGQAPATGEAGPEASENLETSSSPDDQEQATSEASAEPEPDREPSEAIAPEADPAPGADDKNRKPAKAKLDPPQCSLSLFGQCLASQTAADSGEATAAEGVTGSTDPGNAKFVGGVSAPIGGSLPSPMRAGIRIPAHVTTGSSEVRVADRKDDLLFPTEEELREIRARNKASGQAADPAPGAGKGTAQDAVAEPQKTVAPAVGSEGGIDPESWAEYGGWYRQDYAILYSPVGHKDRFLYAWLKLTGLEARQDAASPAAAIFASLTAKDAQGACTKCHSVDDAGSRERQVNFAPLKANAKAGRFTSFVHEPHFGILDDRGCLTCHDLKKAPAGSAYLKSYEQSDPRRFASNFSTVSKDLCRSCHTAGMARQDCLTCHRYHVNGVESPITATRNPSQ